MALQDKIKNYTDELEQKGLLRRRQVKNEVKSLWGQFDTNDYLSLSQNPRIATAYQKGYVLYPSGSGSSMLLSGYHSNHRALERVFADLLEVDECILFSSGYAANLAITALLGRIQAHCLIDKSIHASVYDGLHVSKVPYSRYIHNNLDDLARKLTLNTQNSALFTEGIFSMSGQIAPLSDIASLCRQNKAELIVDEAHSFGILGNQGKGAVFFHHLSQNEVPLRVIPFGKALASQGAVVAGKKEWINALLQAGRSIIYSTAISPALTYGVLKTLDVVVRADDRRLKLTQLIGLFKHHIKLSPLQWIESETPIQQLILGCPHKALYYSEKLRLNGFSCSAIRSPTVTRQATGLRIIINYSHTEEQIKQLFTKLHLIYEHSSH